MTKKFEAGISREYNFLTLHKSKEGYEYAERKGIHSIAFVAYQPTEGKVLLRNEYKPPVSAWVLGAFGGSIDPDKSLSSIVLNEAKEEANLTTTVEKLHFVGKYLVSTQMNQYCYLYVISSYRDTLGDEGHKQNTTDKLEGLSANHWFDVDNIPVLEDWKASILIEYIRKHMKE